jgi:hypothetical protein
MEPIQPPCEGFTPMAEQMPPVEDLWGIWCAKGGAARIRRRAVTAEDGHAWMRPEPGRERVGGAIGPHVNRPMALQVHQQGARGAPPTHGPIVHPEDGRRWHGRIRQLADKPQSGIGAGGHMERGAQPRPGFAAERKPQWLQHRGQTHRALSRGPHHLWQAFGDCLHGTGDVQTANTSDVQDQAHGAIPEGKIAWPARVGAMNAWRGDPATRAMGRGCSGLGGNREDAVVLIYRGHRAPW